MKMSYQAMLKYCRYNKNIFSCAIILLFVLICIISYKNIKYSEIYNFNNIKSKTSYARDIETSSFSSSRNDTKFSLDELGVNLEGEIYNNSSALYHKILQYASNNPDRIISIWNFSKRYDDSNSVILKSGLLVLIIQNNFDEYSKIVKGIPAENFSKLISNLESDIGSDLVNLTSSEIINLIKWNRSNPEYSFSMIAVVKKLSNHELLSVQLDHTVKSIDECDKEIAMRLSNGSLSLANPSDSIKPSDAVGYMYGRLSGLNVFDARHLESDPMNFLNREKVLLGAADQIAINQNLNEIITSIKFFEPKYINRIFSYMASFNSEKTANNIDDILEAGINADYPIAGFVEGYVNLRPKLTDEGKRYILKMIENVHDEKIKNQLLNHEKLRAD